MAKPFDYSKWDKIELSDDESDLHPNIDKASWFRMKHRSRLEREEKEDEEIKKFEQQNAENQARLNVIKARLGGLQGGQEDEDAEFEDIDALQGEAKELEQKILGRKSKIAEYMERRAWNTDNICKVTDEKTVVTSGKTTSLRGDDFAPTGITEASMASSTPPSMSSDPSVVAALENPANDVPVPPKSGKAPTAKSVSAPAVPPAAPPATKPITGPAKEDTKATPREKFAIISYNDYVLGHESLLETYSEIRDLEESKEYVFKHCDILLHEHAQSYMLLSCLEDEMNGKRERMKLVCRQSQILSHITELAVSLHRDPRDMVLPFFRRIEEKEYLGAFLKAVSDFMERIKKRAVDKRKEMDADRLEEEVPLGPGGLNPLEVLRMLPQDMQDAFESQDIARLQSVLAAMKPTEAKKYMKLCVDSGLWVANDESVFEGDEDDDDITPTTSATGGSRTAKTTTSVPASGGDGATAASVPAGDGNRAAKPATAPAAPDAATSVGGGVAVSTPTPTMGASSGSSTSPTGSRTGAPTAGGSRAAATTPAAVDDELD